MEIKLSDSEIEVLKIIMSQLAIKGRTGEVGIMHGSDRFVSTQVILKKDAVLSLQQVAKKMGGQVKSCNG